MGACYYEKYQLEYEDRDIINDPSQYEEMVTKSGQPFPCVEIDGHMLPDISGGEVENYMLSNGLVAPSEEVPEVPTNAPCTDEEHEAMRSKTIRFSEPTRLFGLR